MTTTIVVGINESHKRRRTRVRVCYSMSILSVSSSIFFIALGKIERSLGTLYVGSLFLIET